MSKYKNDRNIFTNSSQPIEFSKKSRKSTSFFSSQLNSRISSQPTTKSANLNGSNSADSVLFQPSTSFKVKTPFQISISNQTDSCHVMKTPSVDGTILVVFLPYIRDTNDKPIKQPLLFKVKESQFLEFGFDIPFSDYFDEFKNLFEIQIAEIILQGQIIAIGESVSELKKCLENCLKLNQEWKNCRKMVGNPGILRQLKFRPILKTSDEPVQRVMNSRDLDNFLQKAESNVTRHVDVMDLSNLYKDSEKEIQTGIEIDITENKLTKSAGQKNLNQATCQCNEQLKSKKVLFETIGKKIDVLVERQKLISQLDLHGSILFELIDIVSDFRSLAIEKDSEEQNSMIHISKQDNTYKVKKKNRIFIEGLVEFELDKYEQALKKAKKRNAFSFAYQLVKTCFPESYFRNVTLGKKYYTKSEIAELLEKKRPNGKEKFPLTFIWGFKNPFDEPLEGEFDLNRGQERVRALIEHILRKSDKLDYDEDLENKIRQRLVKELCSRNKVSGKNQNADDFDENEDADDDNESVLNNVWDNNCFDGN